MEREKSGEALSADLTEKAPLALFRFSGSIDSRGHPKPIPPEKNHRG
jgi:hypothetical protein